MATPDRKTLLAALLALSDLETPLSEDEKSDFRGIAEQLFVEPDNWELVEPALLKLINKTSQLLQLFQNYKSRLDRLEGDIPQPTEADLKSFSSQDQSNSEIRLRGAPPRQNGDETKNCELVNIAIRVMESNPVETAKNTTYLKERKQSLKE